MQIKVGYKNTERVWKKTQGINRVYMITWNMLMLFLYLPNLYLSHSQIIL